MDIHYAWSQRTKWLIMALNVGTICIYYGLQDYYMYTSTPHQYVYLIYNIQHYCYYLFSLFLLIKIKRRLKTDLADRLSNDQVNQMLGLKAIMLVTYGLLRLFELIRFFNYAVTNLIGFILIAA